MQLYKLGEMEQNFADLIWEHAPIASGRRIIKGIPLAFGEVDTKQRIKNVLRYRKPARILIIAAVIASVILAIQFLAYPSDETNSGNEENAFYGVVTYADEGEEIFVMETYPARFSHKAEKIEVMGRGPFALQFMGENRYRFTVPMGMAPDVQTGDLLNIYRLGTDGNGRAQDKELLSSVEILEIVPEYYQIWVNMSTEEAEAFLKKFGTGIECELIKQDAGQENPQGQAQSQEQMTVPV